MLYINRTLGEKTLLCTSCLLDIIKHLNPLDRLIDIDDNVSWDEMVKYNPNRNFTMFRSENKRVYLFI
jgi:hypothetical protein